MKTLKEVVFFTLLISSLCEITVQVDGDSISYNDFERHVSIHESVYHFYNESCCNDTEAELICNKYQGSLAHVKTQDVSDLITSNIVIENDTESYHTDMLWIGLHRVGNTTEFEWSDGTLLDGGDSNPNWHKTFHIEPNNIDGHEYCVGVSTKRCKTNQITCRHGSVDYVGQWVDKRCNIDNKFICENKFGTGFVSQKTAEVGRAAFVVNCTIFGNLTYGSSWHRKVLTDKVDVTDVKDAAIYQQVEANNFHRTSMLTFANPHVTEEGMYFCEQYDPNGATIRTLSTNLTTTPFVDPPDIPLTRHRLSETTEITCTARGRPIPTILWKIDDLFVVADDKIFQVSETENRATLTATSVFSIVSPFSYEANTKLSCLAEGVDLITDHIYLNTDFSVDGANYVVSGVHDNIKCADLNGTFTNGICRIFPPPFINEPIYPTENHKIAETQNITCSVRGRQMPTITWLLNGHELERNDRIFQITNTKNDTELTTTSVFSIVNPTTIPQNSQLSCISNGSEVKTVDILINTDLTYTKSKWIVADVTNQTHCEQIQNGTLNTDGKCQIEPKPFLSKPKLTFKKEEIGDIHNINCSARGYPIPTITWEANGRVIQEHTVMLHVSSKVNRQTFTTESVFQIIDPFKFEENTLLACVVEDLLEVREDHLRINVPVGVPISKPATTTTTTTTTTTPVTTTTPLTTNTTTPTPATPLTTTTTAITTPATTTKATTTPVTTTITTTPVTTTTATTTPVTTTTATTIPVTTTTTTPPTTPTTVATTTTTIATTKTSSRPHVPVATLLLTNEGICEGTSLVVQVKDPYKSADRYTLTVTTDSGDVLLKDNSRWWWSDKAFKIEDLEKETFYNFKLKLFHETGSFVIDKRFQTHEPIPEPVEITEAVVSPEGLCKVEFSIPVNIRPSQLKDLMVVATETYKDNVVDIPYQFPYRHGMNSFSFEAENGYSKYIFKSKLTTCAGRDGDETEGIECRGTEPTTVAPPTEQPYERTQISFVLEYLFYAFVACSAGLHIFTCILICRERKKGRPEKRASDGVAANVPARATAAPPPAPTPTPSVVERPQERSSVAKKTSSLMKETSPIMKETSSIIRATSSAAEVTPSVVEQTPSIVWETPAVAEWTPPIVWETPSVAEWTPSVAEWTPEVVEETPSVTEVTPSVTKVTPSVTEVTPSVTEVTPSVTEVTPSVTEVTPSVTEVTPEVVEETPAVVEETPDVVEETPEVVEETPEVVEETPEVVEEAPEEVEETPEEVEEAPEEVEEAPEEVEEAPED